MDRARLLLYKSNMTRTPAPPILNYNLFGEAGDLPDVVHCETIEVRSKLHDWELAPHRHARLHQVLLIDWGGGRAMLEDDTFALDPRTFVNVPTGAVHAFSFTPGTQGWVLTIATEMMDETLEASEGLRHALSGPAVFPAGQWARPLMEQIFEEHAGRNFARAQILRSLTGVLLGQVARALVGTVADTGRDDPGGLYERFLTLVEDHFLDRWPVSAYADALSITPTHLSRITRANTGQPASRIVEERLVREARRNLVYTNLPVSQIAYMLGYNDPAYFSRVFANATGMAPREFRSRVDA